MVYYGEAASRKIDELYALGIPVYSYSKLTTGDECMYGYDLTYNQKKKQVDNIYSHLGGAVHAGLEDIYNGKENKLMETFQKAWVEAEEKDLKFTDDTIKRNYYTCIEHYINNFVPEDLQGTQEFLFLIEIQSVWVRGYVDRITRDPLSDDKTLRIMDFKTSSKFTSKSLQGYGRQLVLYGYALEQLTGYKVTSLCWNMLKMVHCEYTGKTSKRTFVQDRNKFVMYWKKEIIDELCKKGHDIEEAIEIWNQYEEFNLIPPELSDKFIIHDALVYYPFTEETVEEMKEWIVNTAKKLESADKFEPLLVTKQSYKCFNLCGHRDKCEALKTYIRNLPIHAVEGCDDLGKWF